MIETIKRLLAEVKEEPALAGSLTEESRILDEVALDSLQLVVFLMKLEDELDLELDYERFDMKNIATLSSLASFLTTWKGTSRSPSC